MDQFTFAERATDWRGNNNIAESLFAQLAQQSQPIPAWIVVGAGTGGTSATIGRYISISARIECDPAFAWWILRVPHSFPYFQAGDPHVCGGCGGNNRGHRPCPSRAPPPPPPPPPLIYAKRRRPDDGGPRRGLDCRRSLAREPVATPLWPLNRHQYRRRPRARQRKCIPGPIRQHRDAGLRLGRSICGHDLRGFLGRLPKNRLARLATAISSICRAPSRSCHDLVQSRSHAPLKRTSCESRGDNALSLPVGRRYFCGVAMHQITNSR